MENKNEYYFENLLVPNYSLVYGTAPARLDAGYTVSGNEIVIYTYLLDSGFPGLYFNKLTDEGWTLSGGVSDRGLTQVTYTKDGEAIAIVSDMVLRRVQISFHVTNAEFSKPPAIE